MGVCAEMVQGPSKQRGKVVVPESQIRVWFACSLYPLRGWLLIRGVGVGVELRKSFLRTGVLNSWA